jgi:mannitol/fructose-specific phosphotransferase system IIA component (Ntr-type)/NhaP-type Na+/H+ or K+/H+ antiporter
MQYLDIFKSFLSQTNDPLSIFLIIAISGIGCGMFFHMIKLPHISGQVLVGIVIGLLFTKQQIHSIDFLSDIALGIMCFTIGTHLSYKVLHNSGIRILTLALFDSFFTFSIIFSVLYTFIDSFDITTCLLISSIAIATAPGTILSLIQKKGARGVFTKTLLGVVALNNLFTILYFEVSKFIGFQISSVSNKNIVESIFASFSYILLTIMLGAIIGYFLTILTKHLHDKGELFAIVVISIVLNIIVCNKLGLSHLLSSLTIGIVYCNTSYHTKRVNKILKNINVLLFAIFFTLAGTHLDLNKLKIAGITGIVFVILRIIAKVFAAYSASKLFKYPQTIKKYLGLGLIPQAGLAIGLVISLSKDAHFSDISFSTISTIILASVAVNELIGPFFSSFSLDLAKETSQAAPRLIDFLHEEFIKIPLDAKDKWDAIDKMTDFLVKTNHLRSITRDEILKNITEREKSASTGIGQQIAIPHARVSSREKLMGVIGILKESIEFDSIDNKPVSIIILIATPKGKEDLHVKILSAVAKIFKDDPLLRKKIVNSASAAEVYDILQTKQVRDINSFLEEI